MLNKAGGGHGMGAGGYDGAGPPSAAFDPSDFPVLGRGGQVLRVSVSVSVSVVCVCVHVHVCVCIHIIYVHTYIHICSYMLCYLT